MLDRNQVSEIHPKKTSMFHALKNGNSSSQISLEVKWWYVICKYIFQLIISYILIFDKYWYNMLIPYGGYCTSPPPKKKTRIFKHPLVWWFHFLAWPKVQLSAVTKPQKSSTKNIGAFGVWWCGYGWGRSGPKPFPEKRAKRFSTKRWEK